MRNVFEMFGPKWKNIVFLSAITLSVLSIAAVITLGVLYSNLLAKGREETTTIRTTQWPETTTWPSNITTVTTPVPVDFKKRINCYPDQQGSSEKEWDVTREQCEERGCTYDLNTGGDKSVPICYMHPKQIGYKVTNINESDITWFMIVQLETLSNLTVFDPPISPLLFKARVWNEKNLQIKIEDARKKRYEVPITTYLNQDPKCNNLSCTDFHLEMTINPFSFQIIRKSTKSVLFDTSMGGFVFSDRFIQLSTLLPSRNFYGLGEHEHPSLRHNMETYKTWPMFARDQAGLGEGYHLYGAHPFYMVLENDANAHGVFLLNSNTMEFSTIPAPGVVMRTIGGIIDLYFSNGPTPEMVVQQHTDLVGRPYIPPYWGLGFHLSRYGYNSLDNMKAAVDRTREAGIPLDAIYADIDHMDKRKDFTIDPGNFSGLPQYFAYEKGNNSLRSVIILDPAIPRSLVGPHYQPWWEFEMVKGWVDWANYTTLFGTVWPDDPVAFPDFFDYQAQWAWINLIVKHSKKLAFDGIWIDMNEPSNFNTNDDRKPGSLRCYDSYYETPPYRTWAAILHDAKDWKAKLSDATICMEAKHINKYRHYDVHSIYGLSQTEPTVHALQEAYPDRRSFVLTRSTFAGSGRYASHWLGDNLATWEHMQRSIIGMLEMSMFGIAHTGADICGFIYPTTPELCLRWMELGAFYPYSRNHNDKDSPDQDPASLGSEVAEASAYYMKIRYQGLPYLYTLFYYANKDGSTVARPLFFEYTSDQQTWGIDRQFMLGSSFMVAPLLEKGESSVTAYLPKDVWVNIMGSSQALFDHCAAGKSVRLDHNGTVLLQRGGSVVPTQSADVPLGTHITTAATRKNPFALYTVFDCSDHASGSLFWDDGESPNTITEGKYILTTYEAVITRGSLLEFSLNQTNLIPENATFVADLHYKWLSFQGKNLANPTKIEVICVDTVNCPKLTCEPYSAATNKLPCQFDGKGIPLTDKNLTVKINF